MNPELYFARIGSPLGTMLLVAADDALAAVSFEGQRYQPEATGAWRPGADHPLLRAASAQLAEYFSGRRTCFDLPLMPAGTPFQRAVWSAIATVPFGRTIAYRELAVRTGRPRSVRAAGTATGRNPWSIVVPCHRIVGSDGTLTGYAGGLARKDALLQLEARH